MSETQRKKFEDNRESAYLSRRIATIILDAPIEFELDKFKTHDIDYPKVKKMFHELEFSSLDKKLDELEQILLPPKVEQTSLF